MQAALKSGAVTEHFTEHDIRAAAATEAQRQGQDPQALLGHQDAATTRRYLRDKAPVHVRPVR
jgi:integrase